MLSLVKKLLGGRGSKTRLCKQLENQFQKEKRKKNAYRLAHSAPPPTKNCIWFGNQKMWAYSINHVFIKKGKEKKKQF